jgi:hypothetical protein
MTETDNRSAAFEKEINEMTLPKSGDNYLFIVAIDKYAPSFEDYADLNNPINDATRLLSVLLDRYTFSSDAVLEDLRVKDKDRYGNKELPIPFYNGNKVKCLYNEDATWSNIKQHFVEICKGNRENDNLVFYFAGHGKVEDDIGSIVLHKKGDDNFNKKYEEVCYTLLDNYTTNKKFRHILFIFDCCFAGSFDLGKGGNTEKEEFSRHVLVSCGIEQTAADATRKNIQGSPFSLAFTSILKDKGGSFTIEDIKNSLKRKVSSTTSGKQDIKYNHLNTKMNGQGHFFFQLKKEEKEKWTTGALTDSVLNNLGFSDARGKIKSKYTPDKSHFNVFSACAETESTHKILGKVLFQMASNISKLQKNQSLALQKPKIIMLDGGIWLALMRQKENNPVFDFDGNANELINSNQKSDIVDWVMGQLRSNENSEAPWTIIFRGDMSLMENEEILNWCKDFHSIFEKHREKINAENSENPNSVCYLKKIVFYFEEVRKGSKTKLIEQIFEGDDLENLVNIVITPMASKFRHNEIGEWAKSLPEDIINEIESSVTKEDELSLINHFLPSGCNVNDCNLDPHDFITHLIKHFKIGDANSKIIINQLFPTYNQ